MTIHKKIAGTLLALATTAGLGIAAAALLNQPASAHKSDQPTTHQTRTIEDVRVPAHAGRDSGLDTPGVNAFTDARYDLESGPLTDGEQDKLAQAREAIERAEAAGTRWVDPLDRPPLSFGFDAEQRKIQQVREKRPQATTNPGVPSDTPTNAPQVEGGAR